MLSSNLQTKIELVNGSMGIVIDLTQELGQDPNTSLPFAILIAFNSYSNLVYLGYNASIVLVFVR